MNDKNTIQKGRKYGQILGINVIGTTLPEVLARVESFLSDSTRKSPFYIVTPNPELILMAQNNLKLKLALNGADLSIPDGVGLKLAIHGLPIIKGRQLFMSLINLAAEKKWKVFLLGGMDNEAELTIKKLKNLLEIKNYKLEIGSNAGPKLDFEGAPVTKVDIKRQKDAIDKINKFHPDLLFVAFGNPKQEIWINKNISKLNIGGAMAVGGTFRYIAGTAPLPPRALEFLGLEWLWRLATEPKRIKRVLNAVIVFPLRLFLASLSS